MPRKSEIAIADQQAQALKYPGKGGWTYVVITGVPRIYKAKFGWVKVKGYVDSYQLKNYKLMPMKDGSYFLPLKTEIRKKIKKEAGDMIHVTLYLDHDPLDIPDEFKDCLMNEPNANTFFHSISEGAQKEYLDWIYQAKTVETKVKRITKTLFRLSEKKKFRDL